MERPKRQHYVPKLLLRRFSPEPSKDKPRVWVFRRGCEPRFESIANVAVVRLAYDLPFARLEERFAHAESRIASALVALDRGCMATDSLPALRLLVALLIARGPFLRNLMREAFLCGLTELANRVSDFAGPDPSTANASHGRGVIVDSSRAPAYLEVSRQGLFAFVREAAAIAVWSSVSALGGVRDSGRWDALWARGLASAWAAMQQALLSLVVNGRPPSRVVEIVTVDRALLLPDFGVFTHDEGQWQPLSVPTDSNVPLVVPLDPHHVLQVSGQAALPVLDSRELNASAVKYACNWVVGTSDSSSEALRPLDEHAVRATSIWKRTIIPGMTLHVGQLATQLHTTYADFVRTVTTSMEKALTEIDAGKGAMTAPIDAGRHLDETKRENVRLRSKLGEARIAAEKEWSRFLQGDVDRG